MAVEMAGGEMGKRGGAVSVHAVSPQQVSAPKSWEPCRALSCLSPLSVNGCRNGRGRSREEGFCASLSRCQLLRAGSPAERPGFVLLPCWSCWDAFVGALCV